MKQFRNSRYWVTENGEVFSYWPQMKKVYNNISKHGYADIKYYNREERYKLIKPTFRPKSGYLCLNLTCKSFNDKGFFNTSIHRMVAEIYVPGYFEGAEVDHIDCNKRNNHYTNLQWCTPDYNKRKGNNPDYPLFSSL